MLLPLLPSTSRLTSVQVRGTPASGKTALLRLLHRYIGANEPSAVVHTIKGWGSDHYERQIQQYDPSFPDADSSVQREGPYLLFDEAQHTYSDSLLWNFFFKEKDTYPYRIVLFCAYGSPGMRLNDHPVGTPMTLPSEARVSLQQHDTDGLGPIGLLLDHNEYDEVVALSHKSSTNELLLDPELHEMFFTWTAGHVGGLVEVLDMLKRKKVSFRSISLFLF